MNPADETVRAVDTYDGPFGTVVRLTYQLIDKEWRVLIDVKATRKLQCNERRQVERFVRRLAEALERG